MRHVTCETLSEWSGDVYIWPVPLKTDREPVKQGTRQVAWLEGPVKIFGGEISNLVLASLPLRIRKNWKLTILGDRLHFGCFYLDNPGAPVIIDPKFCPLPISRTWFSLTLIARWWVYIEAIIRLSNYWRYTAPLSIEACLIMMQ